MVCMVCVRKNCHLGKPGRHTPTNSIGSVFFNTIVMQRADCYIAVAVLVTCALLVVLVFLRTSYLVVSASRFFGSILTRIDVPVVVLQLAWGHICILDICKILVLFPSYIFVRAPFAQTPTRSTEEGRPDAK